MHDRYSVEFTLRFSLGMVLAVAFGFLFFWWAASLSHQEHGPWPDILNHIGVAFFAGAGIALFEKLVVHQHVFHQLRDLMGVRNSITEAGLERAQEAGIDDTVLSSVIRSSPVLRVVINYGGKWLDKDRWEDFHKRFQSPNIDTEIYQIDPDSPFLDLLAGKQRDRPEKIKEKIKSTRETLISLHKQTGNQGKLRIFNILDFPTYSLCLGTDRAIISLYPISGVEGARPHVPQFIFIHHPVESSLYRFFVDDVTRLQRSAGTTEVFNSAKWEDRPDDLAGRANGLTPQSSSNEPMKS